MFREIRERGYRGSRVVVTKYIAILRAAPLPRNHATRVGDLADVLKHLKASLEFGAELRVWASAVERGAVDGRLVGEGFDVALAAEEFVRPLLPKSSRGRKRLDDRLVLNGIVWKFRTGVAWRDVPERYDPWAILHTRFRRWALDGTFERMLQAAQARADAAGDIDWLVSVDSTVVRAHHAAGARRGGSAAPQSDVPEVA